MGPDHALRRQVNHQLRSRPNLSVHTWYQQRWLEPALATPDAKPLIYFLYDRLAAYSGLCIGRTYPGDKLFEDLQFPMVCWFDWGITLCEDVQSTFRIDISESFDERDYITLLDLANYLQEQVRRQSTDQPSCF